MKISDEQKKQMLEEFLHKHRSVTQVAQEYNVSINYFKRLCFVNTFWTKRYVQFGLFNKIIIPQKNRRNSLYPTHEKGR